MDFETYTRATGVNWSRLKLMARSPRHYRYGYGAASKDSAARRIGRLAHLMVLEPERAAEGIAAWGGPGNRASKAFKEWAATVPSGVEIVTEDEYDRAAAMADAVRAHPVASVLLAHGRAEQSILWTDSEFGVDCKARLDWLIESCTEEQAELLGVPTGSVVVVDLKTTGSVERTAKDCARHMYHGQMAHYAAAAEHEIGRPVAAVVIVHVETAEPNDVACDLLPLESSLYGGQLLRRGLMQRLVECERTCEWPGAAPGLRVMELPAWAPGWEFEDEDDNTDSEEGA